MHQDGPIISHMVYRRCTGLGPLAYAEAAADHFAWAHYFYTVCCRHTRMGPLENIEPAAVDFTWTYYFSCGVPPMY